MKYTLTSQSFPGNIIIAYDANDRLVELHISSALTDQQYKWLLTNLPDHRSKLESVVKQMKAKAALVPTDLSFNSFWTAYNKKINRVRCEPVWAKMQDTDRLDCLMSIPAYNSFLVRHNGRAKLDPENYLKNKCWTNNYNSL